MNTDTENTKRNNNLIMTLMVVGFFLLLAIAFNSDYRTVKNQHQHTFGPWKQERESGITYGDPDFKRQSRICTDTNCNFMERADL